MTSSSTGNSASSSRPRRPQRAGRGSGGKGRGDGSPGDWDACLQRYNLTEEQAATFAGNPIDKLEPLAEAGIPLLLVCGADDTAVPVDENARIVEERYRALGGRVDIIIKKNCGHHPHSLEDPKPIVDFILQHTAGPRCERPKDRGL